MRHSIIGSLLFAALVTWPGTLAHAGKGDGHGPNESRGECVQVRTEARYSGYGYDHIVHLDNQCDTDQRCEVSTDVNPKVQNVTVAAGRSTSIVTFRGSPARTFTPKVECKSAGS